MSLRAGLAVVMWFQSWALAFGNRCINKSDIELYDPNDHSKFRCWRTRCYEGQESTLEPGSAHPDRKDIDVSCRPCGHDLFSNHATNYRCTKCKTCGNMKVISNCTVLRDTVCSTTLCRSKMFYFNKTDGHCHLCSECCGTDNANIELQCLVAFSHVGSVTGQKGAFHCKEVYFQRCDVTSNVSSNVNNTSVVKSDNALEDNCSKPVNNTIITPSTSDQEGRSLDSLHILFICFCILLLLVCIFLFCLYKRERKRLRNGCSCNCTPLICRGGSTDQGQGQRHISDFQERLNAIPEGLRIDSIDDVVQGYIEKLDAKKSGVKHWYDVGRKLELSNDDLDEIKRYDTPGESPTRTLVSKLSTWAVVITLRRFTQALHDVKRYDICNNIIKYYENGQQDSPV